MRPPASVIPRPRTKTASSGFWGTSMSVVEQFRFPRILSDIKAWVRWIVTIGTDEVYSCQSYHTTEA